jgi:IclR family transcriptional regulator, acetate operon repressor
LNHTHDDERLVGADRVLAVLIELAEHPEGISLEDMATFLHSPKPTVHRALASLRRAKLASQSARGMYVLGDDFFRLAFRNHANRPESERIDPVLQRLAREIGETAHYAVLDGPQVVYRAKVDPPAGAVRLTSVIGGRNPAYSTGTGKMLLSYAAGSERELRQILGPGALGARTPNTRTSMDELWRELVESRERGFALDDQENEVGVNCVAVPVFAGAADRPTGAVSVSGLSFRRSLDDLIGFLPLIRREVGQVFGTTE